MCRICGRMVKCIFDTMPSRVSTVSVKRALPSSIQPPLMRSQARQLSSRKLSKSGLRVEPRLHHRALPTFLLPFRAKLHQTTTQNVIVDSSSQFHNDAVELPPSMIQPSEPVTTTPISITQDSVVSSPSKTDKPLILSKSLQLLLPVLETQKPHYMTAHIHRFPYLIQAGDTLRLPFHMHGVEPGDILRLNRASIIGSRDYTLKAGMNSTESYDKRRTGEPNYLDERLFECRARVLGVDSQPMTFKEKTKRRNRKVKTAKSKHRYTMLKIMDVKVKTLQELKTQQGTLLLE